LLTSGAAPLADFSDIDMFGDQGFDGGDTTISLLQLTQRALVPTISQASSQDTMPRRHFGQM